MLVYGPAEDPYKPLNMLKTMLVGSLFYKKGLKEQLRFAYADVARVFFARKRTVKIELKDGRYVFAVLNPKNQDLVAGQLASHGIPAEPFQR